MSATPSEESPRLPADIVANIFDISGTPIDVLMDSGFCSRFLIREVLPKLTRLVIRRAKDLDVPTARRFLDTDHITSIDICCLIKKSTHELSVFPGQSSQEYDVETSHRAPSFLSQFANLAYVFFGGTRETPSLCTYEPYMCVGPEDHREFHHGLFWALCGAFRTGALSKDLQMDGFVQCGLYCLWSSDHRQREEEDEEGAKTCRFCNAVLEHFPLSLIAQCAVGSRGDSTLCFNERQIFEKLRKRSESDLWTLLMDDMCHPPRQNNGISSRPLVTFMPGWIERICRLKRWGLGPDCSKAYWKRIRSKFMNMDITRTAVLVLQHLDGGFKTNGLKILEDDPRPRLRQLLTTQGE